MPNWLIISSLLGVPVTAVVSWAIVTSGDSDDEPRRPRYESHAEPEEDLAPAPTYRPSTERVRVSRTHQETPQAPPEEQENPEAPPLSEADVEAQLEHRFQTDEPVSGGHEAESELLTAFADYGRVETLTCKTSTCRLEASFDSKEAADKLFEDYFLSPSYELGLAGTVTSRETGPDGRMSLRLYLYEDQDPGLE